MRSKALVAVELEISPAVTTCRAYPGEVAGAAVVQPNRTTANGIATRRRIGFTEHAFEIG